VPVYAQADDAEVTFHVTGAGRLIGAGSGNPQRIASFQSGKVTTFHGRAVAVIQSGTEPGEAIIVASGRDMPVERISVRSVDQ
jgi:beta-galactosidase